MNYVYQGFLFLEKIIGIVHAAQLRHAMWGRAIICLKIVDYDHT